MKVEMVMPQMGESITEATISRWLKSPGDRINKDEIILEISTDKVDSEIPATASGVLVEVLFNEGDVVPVKTVIARIDTEAKESVAENNKLDNLEKSAVSVATQDTSAKNSNNSQSHSSISGEEGEDIAIGEDKFISPLVKSLAERHGVPLEELSSLSGSGSGGRITKNDFNSFLEKRNAASTPSTSSSSSSSPSASVGTPIKILIPNKSSTPKANGMPALGEWAADGTKVVPMDAMRQAISDHMVRSKHTSPHVYSIQEVDVTKVSAWRQKYKGAFQKQEGFNLTITPFFLEAAVHALKAFPIVNASVLDRAILYKKHINLGCAVALPNAGLIVPVIKQAEEKNLVGLARGLQDLSVRARDKKLLPNDVQGGSFTVTNVGGFGTVIGTPIINQPQAAILCVGAAKKRPVVINDMIAIREMVYLTLSYDHRIIDGAIAGQFLRTICEYLEGWDMERSLF